MQALNEIMNTGTHLDGYGTWQEYLQNCVDGYNGETSFWHYAPSGAVCDCPGEPLLGYKWDENSQYWTLVTA